MIRTYLERIDRQLSTKAPQVAAGLCGGAGEKEVGLLRQVFFGGKAVPEDLDALFRWHDGQSGYESLSPLDNRMLLSIQEALDTWIFLSNPDEDIQQPWDKCWLPILANGAGDYIVYVSAGEAKGQLLTYWHDSEDRRVAFASLEAWAEKVLASYERQAV